MMVQRIQCQYIKIFRLNEPGNSGGLFWPKLEHPAISVQFLASGRWARNFNLEIELKDSTCVCFNLALGMGLFAERANLFSRAFFANLH
jgi:hypothetical protein